MKCPSLGFTAERVPGKSLGISAASRAVVNEVWYERSHLGTAHRSIGFALALARCLMGFDADRRRGCKV